MLWLQDVLQQLSVESLLDDSLRRDLVTDRI
jgi:hypothetical protein